MNSTPHEDIERIRTERDLFLRLLQLSGQEDLHGFLRSSLDLVLELTGARKGYLELYTEEDGPPRWSLAFGCTEDEVEGIREAISHGIIARAMASGETVSTASALNDPRFAEQASVQFNKIMAVLCAPIGGGDGEAPMGVLYLQERAKIGPFDKQDKHYAELVARHLAPQVDRLLLKQHALDQADPTRPWRDKLDIDGFVGASQPIADVLRTVALVAPLDMGVLITGPTGTGKSEIARAIHRNSPRASGPLVEINCAAIPDTLVESELFGAMPGAASGITRKMEGKVSAAEGGTLFLDEIAELPLQSQSKILQLLQSREYYRLGSSRPEVADIRIVAATNRDLDEAVAEKHFREDLYFRLNVVPLRMPGLAEHPEDVPLLADFLLERAVRKYRLPRLRLSPAAAGAMTSAEWPGNVRELVNTLERAAVMAAGDASPTIEPAHVFPDRAAPEADELPGDLTFQEATRRFQRTLIADALADTGWNVSETARRLGLARSYLYDLINAHGLQRS